MSKLNEMYSALAAATDDDGYTVTQSEYDRLRKRESYLCDALDIAEQQLVRVVDELAELRKAQGEPVAMSISANRGHSRGLRWAGKNGEAYYQSKAAGHDVEPLYTSAPTIPEGWQLVPVNPTFEMLQAACESIKWYEQEVTARAVHRAMLAAAPKPTKDAA